MCSPSCHWFAHKHTADPAVAFLLRPWYASVTQTYPIAESMELIEPGQRWAKPLVLIVAVVLIAWLLRAPQPPLTAPPAALRELGGPAPLQGQFEAQAAPKVPAVRGEQAPLAGYHAVVVADQLALYTREGSYTPEQVQALVAPLGEALAYVSTRTNMQLAASVTIVFDHRAHCGLDGAAYTQKRVIMLYACPDLPPRRAVNILAHEFVHQLAYDHYGAPHLQADLILSEGLATWGAGKYWLGSEPDFRSFVQHNYATALLPLDSDYQAIGTIDAMNRLYYQWASLVDFVLETHGRDAFDQLYRSGRGMAPNTADYAGVLGTDLPGLQPEWQAWLNNQP